MTVLSFLTAHLMFIGFISAMGFSKGDVKNLTTPQNPNNLGGFWPNEFTRLFNEAALAYLSYIGCEVVSTMDEDINPLNIFLLVFLICYCRHYPLLLLLFSCSFHMRPARIHSIQVTSLDFKVRKRSNIMCYDQMYGRI